MWLTRVYDDLTPAAVTERTQQREGVNPTLSWQEEQVTLPGSLFGCSLWPQDGKGLL